MAAFKRLPSGLWQVQIFRRGVRRSASFPSKGAAIAWAGEQESEIMSGIRGGVPNLTVKELLERYKLNVSPGKKGARWETIRLERMQKDKLGRVNLRHLDSPHVSDWQDRRLAVVSSATVRRERNLLNNAFQIAIKEWRWLRRNPFEGVRRPKDGKARTRLATPAELEKLIEAASPALARAITFAVETGIRAGEIARAEVRGNVAYLPDSKNGTAREVPLSSRAIEAWGGGITLTSGSISALFAQLCQSTKIEGLTFHDLRRTAIVQLSKKLDAFELAKMVGHKDLRMTLNVYYKADSAAIADKLK
jgi:integrase